MASYSAAPIVRDELLEIWSFIAEDNVDAANRVLHAAEKTFQILADNPGLGHRRSFRQKAHRHLRVRSVEGFDQYLVLYREVTGGIEVLHVYHVARNIAALLRKDPRT